jgi:hypothetical protein
MVLHVKWLSHDFIHTLINQLWRLLSGPALLLILPLFLSAEIQGYWFTFISLAALAIFADFGFTVIILQWSAHEFAQLSFDENHQFIGNDTSQGRISSLFVFSVRWAGFMVAMALPIIFALGYFLLSQKSTAVNWPLPWFAYCAASILIFINNLILSFFEGCNSVGKIQKIRFYISVASSVATISGIVAGFELYALAAGLVVSSLVGAYLIHTNYSATIRQMLSLYKTCQHPWKSELSPLLLRYAISWASGYFIFQIFTPIAFYYFGAIEAGRVGLSIAALVAIYGIANIWMTIIVPKMNIFIAQDNYSMLNALFKMNLGLSIVTYLFGVAAFFILISLFGKVLGISDRFVGTQSLLIIAIAWLLQMIVSAWAVYIRAHKQEPLVRASLAWAVYTSLTTLALAAYWPSGYYFLGFLSGYILVLPWFYVILKAIKRKLCLNDSQSTHFHNDSYL